MKADHVGAESRDIRPLARRSLTQMRAYHAGEKAPVGSEQLTFDYTVTFYEELATWSVAFGRSCYLF